MINLRRATLNNLVRGWSKFIQVPDAELRDGTPLLVNEALFVRNGRAAAVFHITTTAGHQRAVRFFLTTPSQDIAERYRELAEYFSRCLADYTVRFAYHERGFLYVEPGRRTLIPVLEMEWVAGQTLSSYVAQLARAQRRAELADLVERCFELFAAMRAAGIAHSDLAGSNLLVQPDGRLKLIDYDGVYIPPLQHLTVNNYGQPPYQHPEVSQRRFDAAMDDYSQLVIVTALTALAHEPQLWDRFNTAAADAADDGDTDQLLFRETCHRSPAQSPVFAAIRTVDDEDVQLLIAALHQAAEAPLSAVRLPPELFDREQRHNRRSLRLLTHLWQRLDDAALNGFDLQSLTQYPPAAALLARVTARRTLLTALGTDDDQRICAATAAAAALDYGSVSASNQERISLALRRQQFRTHFETLVAAADDAALIAWVGTTVQPGPREFFGTFLPEQLAEQLAAARRRIMARFRAALADNDPYVIRAAAETLHTSAIDPAEIDESARQRIDWAEQIIAQLAALRGELARAADERDAPAIAALIAAHPSLIAQLSSAEAALVEEARLQTAQISAVHRAVIQRDERRAAQLSLAAPFTLRFLTAAEQQFCCRAQSFSAHAAALRQALDQGNPLTVATVYQPDQLRVWVPVFYHELALLELAPALLAALQRVREASNDQQMLTAMDQLTAVLPTAEASLEASLRRDVRAARRRTAISAQFTELRNTQSTVALVRLLRSESDWLPNYQGLCPQERTDAAELLAQAVLRDQAAAELMHGRDTRALQIADQIEDQALRDTLGAARLHLANERRRAIALLAEAITGADDADRERRIVRAATPQISNHPDVSDEQRARVALARRRVQLTERVRRVIKAGLPARMLAGTIDSDLLPDVLDLFTEAEKQQIRAALHSQAAETPGTGSVVRPAATLFGPLAADPLRATAQLQLLAEVKPPTCSLMQTAGRHFTLRLRWPSASPLQMVALVVHYGRPAPRPEAAAAADTTFHLLERSSLRERESSYDVDVPYDGEWHLLIVPALRRQAAAAESAAACWYGRRVAVIVVQTFAYTGHSDRLIRASYT